MCNYRSLSKYSSARDELLHQFVLDGWANDSNGMSDAPTGAFAIIKIEHAELEEVYRAFHEQVLEMEQYEDFARIQLIGNFVCIENSVGHWDVYPYDLASQAQQAYDKLEVRFDQYIGA